MAASFLEKIKQFFKRSREQSDANNDDGPRPTKRARYCATPATVRFSPKEVKQKRVQRSFYVLDEILAVTEDRNYEFKAGGYMLQTHTLREYIQKYGSAFLNSEGGVLLGGVRDDGQVIGLFCDNKKSTQLVYTIKEEFELFRPHVSRDKYKVNFMPVYNHRGHEIPHCKVIEIHIYKGDGDFLYESGRHEVFIRRDGGVQGPLRPIAIKDIVEQKYQKVLAARRAKPVKVKPGDTHEYEDDRIGRKRKLSSNGNRLETLEEERPLKHHSSTVPTSDATIPKTKQSEAKYIELISDSSDTDGSGLEALRRSTQSKQEPNLKKDFLDLKTSPKELDRKRNVDFIDLTKNESIRKAFVPIRINRTFNPMKTARKFFDDIRTKINH